jgi:hypothetical protein
VNSKAYRLYDPVKRNIITSRDVTFDELITWKIDGSNGISRELIQVDNKDEGGDLEPNSEVNNGGSDGETTSSPSNESGSINLSNSSNGSSSNGSSSTNTSDESGESSLKVRTLTDLYDSTHPIENVYDTCQFARSLMEPTSYNEASLHKEWVEAMETELKALQHHNTWTLTALPQDKQAIGLKWVFKTKFDANGKVHKYKARLVAKGYAQQYCVGYKDTFSLVARFETIRIVLSLAAQKGWKVFQFDV